MTGTEACVEVQGLSVVTARHKVPVVEDVSFSVPAAKIMGLVGESGSGKSTVGLALLNHARRGLAIATGTVRVSGTSMLDLTGPELRRARGALAAYVPQDPASGLNPILTLGSQLREAIAIHPEHLHAGETPDDRVARLLDEVRLPHTRQLLRSYPHQVSGGQAQRVAIAMAFACRPRLIVLDEPTTGLDVTTQRHILETIRQLAESHEVSAVYVSHDLAVVAEIADSTAVMYAGRLVEHASSAALFTAPRHPYTAGLLRAAPTPDRASELVGIEGHPPRPGSWPAGCVFADRCENVTAECLQRQPPLEPIELGHLLRCLHPVARYEPPAFAAARTVAATDEATLRVSGLSARYGNVQILHDVDFSVGRGRCLGIVGESGSGKTTLARCLIGLHSNWSGVATLEEHPLDPRVARRRPGDRKRMQYIFQNPHASLNPRLSVAENVGEPLRFFDGGLGRRERRAKVLEVLEQVALGSAFADRMPGQLSGGERQRVAVARALTVDPELLICDEITSALDVSVQALLIEQLRELQRQRGLTMVFITHNLGVVRSIAQDVLVLEYGRVVEAGPVETVLSNPRHPYTKQLMADLPRFDDALAGPPARV